MHHRPLVKHVLRGGLLIALIGAMAAAPASAQEDFDDPSVLISTEQLDSLLRRDLTIRVIDLRPTEKFQAGRIPYALSLPGAAILDATSRIEGSRRADAELAEMFGQLGIGRDNQVVLYDDKGGHQAARVLWIFHYFGHQNVSVLDGGFPKWQEEGRPVTRQMRQVVRASFPIDLTPRRLATAEWILDNMSAPHLLIIDVRPPERYEESHIPGAINVPWQGNLNADQTWKGPDELRSLYENAGVTEDKNIVVYCQGGFHNGHTYLTLKALGYPRVRSYDRAWPEWGSDPSLPKSVGPSPGSAGAAYQDGEQTAAEPQPGQVEAQGRDGLDVMLIGGVGLFLAFTGIAGAVVWRRSRRRTPTIG